VDRQRITPATTALVWRTAGTALLGALWVAESASDVALVLLLCVLVMGLVRWRFSLRAWTVLVDQALCAAALALWPGGGYAFALPVFDACLAASPALALPALAALTLFRAWSIPSAAVVIAAALAGWVIHLWVFQLQGARLEADRDRREHYELESLKGELLAASVRIARMAELAVRARIARDLHDHAGHEIQAAQLALQASRRLQEEGDPQASEMLEEAERRVADGMALLRSTVHGISPVGEVGIGSLEEICRRFTACEVGLSVHGDTDAVPIHAWSVLEPCLKEALTNAARHAPARRVDVSLDVGPHIVRLAVHTLARGAPADGRGLGLHNLTQRARAVGGSITTDTRDGFRLVCVLPLGEAPP
jgi:two-component system, NarL family, sensor histidine kinase DesK